MAQQSGARHVELGDRAHDAGVREGACLHVGTSGLEVAAKLEGDVGQLAVERWRKLSNEQAKQPGRQRAAAFTSWCAAPPPGASHGD